jgi:hypothetical protein
VKLIVLSAAFVMLACDDYRPTTDDLQAQEQAKALAEAHAQIGMPAIGDFSEKRMLKDLYELRDKPFPTHAYIVNEMNGCLMYLGPAMGYGLPYATQYTAPTRTAISRPGGTGGVYSVQQIPQAEPNGLFMPTSAEGTWVMLKSPTEDKVQAVYIEPRVVVSPFRLTQNECPTKVPETTVVATKK